MSMMRTMFVRRMAPLVSLFLLSARSFAAQVPAAPVLTIDGDVETKITLSLAEFRAMEEHTRFAVEAQGRKASYEGVAVTELLRRAGIIVGRAPLERQNVTRVLFVTASDGSQAVFSIAELAPASPDARVILADKRDGEAFPDREGPLRLIVPGDKFPQRSVRSVARLTVITPTAPK